ncbi:MAG: hypothetical protein ACRD0J_08685 [Acidimicrobiales bacterium]
MTITDIFKAARPIIRPIRVERWTPADVTDICIEDALAALGTGRLTRETEAAVVRRFGFRPAVAA